MILLVLVEGWKKWAKFSRIRFGHILCKDLAFPWRNKQKVANGEVKKFSQNSVLVRIFCLKFLHFIVFYRVNRF
jgi:hypothetical protein